MCGTGARTFRERRLNGDMNADDPEELIESYLDDTLSVAGREALRAWLRSDPAHLKRFADEVLFARQTRAAVLASAGRSAATGWDKAVPRRHWLPWRSLAAAAAGLAVGLFCASPRAVATLSRLIELADGGFEQGEGPIPAGFPRRISVWSGDEAEVVASPDAAEGRRVLQFLRAGPDLSAPGGQAISCDVFQWIDLRPLRRQLAEGGDAVLEVSARFRDAREAPQGSVTFTCQVFLFRGQPEVLAGRWPGNLGDAVASGSMSGDFPGGSPRRWEELTARCLIPSQADFAVVQVAARANLRPASLEGLFVDDVRLSLKTQPVLPVRVARY